MLSIFRVGVREHRASRECQRAFFKCGRKGMEVAVPVASMLPKWMGLWMYRYGCTGMDVPVWMYRYGCTSMCVVCVRRFVANADKLRDDAWGKYT